MKIFYSNTTRGFYPSDMRSDYEAAGTWPSDLVEVTPAEEACLRAALAASDIIERVDGAWTFTPRPPTPYAEVSAAYLGTVRSVRDEVLNRLAGIGFAALADGDTATTQAVVAARRALLDITTMPAVLAATDAASIAVSVRDIYLSIIASAPENVRGAFNSGAL